VAVTVSVTAKKNIQNCGHGFAAPATATDTLSVLLTLALTLTLALALVLGIGIWSLEFIWNLEFVIWDLISYYCHLHRLP